MDKNTTQNVPPDAETSSRSASWATTKTVESVKNTTEVDVLSAIATSGRVDDRPAPTAEEKTTLRRVADTVPKVSFLLCIVELAERASYYGTKTVFNNYMQFPLPAGGNGAGAVARDRPNDHAGALNQGLRFATAMGLLFTFSTNLVPLFGAWLADAKLGRYKVILIGVVIGLIAHVVMIGGAAPALLMAGQGLAPFLISFFLLALGAGIFKPNVIPLVVDQYVHRDGGDGQHVEYVKTLQSGERVIVDPETTVNRIMLIFYSCINIGAFFAIPSTYTEKYVGFWLSFLIPGVVYLLLPILLWAMCSRTIRRPPQGSELVEFFHITLAALRNNRFRIWTSDFWDAALPSPTSGMSVPWTAKRVREVARTYEACVIFLYFPLYNINNGGIGPMTSNMGAAMRSDGAPNDLLSNFNQIAVVAASPLMTYVIYPFLERRRIQFGRIRRMTFGFLMCATSASIAAVVQWRVYATSPCGWAASTCNEVSPISIWWQLPQVMLGATSELFCNVTAYEIAYARAPQNMKSMVVSMFLLSTALSSALGQVILPAVKDPLLLWVWAGPAIALYVQTAVFYWRHHKIDHDEFMIHEEESEERVEGVTVESSPVASVPGKKDERSSSAV